MSMTESERYTWWDDGEAYSNYIRPAVTKRLAEYEDIGTVSEFRELKEKATAKKLLTRQERYPSGYGMYSASDRWCPNCKTMLFSGEWNCYARKYSYGNAVCECGQKLDWSEGKE